MISSEVLKKIVKLTAQILIVVICFAYAFSEIDYNELFLRFKTIELVLIFPVLFIIFSGYFFLALRLVVLLKSYSLDSFYASFNASFNASIITSGVNTIFPLKLGEIAKVFYLNRRLKISLSKSFSLIIWERFADINLLALLGLVTMAFYQPNVNLQPFFIAVVILWVGLFIYLKVNFIYNKLTFFLPLFIQNLLNQLHTALIAKRTSVDVLSIVVLTIVVWFIYVFQIWFILEKLLLIELNPPQLLTVFVVTALGMAVPSVPGALGVYEAAMVLALGWFGIDKTEALMAGIVCHAFILIPCTLISLLILSNMHISIHSFKEILLKTKKKSAE